MHRFPSLIFPMLNIFGILKIIIYLNYFLLCCKANIFIYFEFTSNILVKIYILLSF